MQLKFHFVSHNFGEFAKFTILIKHQPKLFIKQSIQRFLSTYLIIMNSAQTQVNQVVNVNDTECCFNSNSEYALIVVASLLKFKHNTRVNVDQVRVSKNELARSSVDQVNQTSTAQNLDRNDTWNDELEKMLFQLHNLHGNRWAKISQFLPGKSDNCIKNHFYCTLRKAFRRINRFISENKSKVRIKQIKDIVLSKIISVAEQKFQAKLDVSDEMIESCCKIKNDLLLFSKDMSISKQNEAGILKLISDISEFSRSFKKRKSKRSKKQSNSNNENLREQGREDVSDGEPTFQNNIGYQKQSPKRIQLDRSIEFNPTEVLADFPEQKGLIYHFQQKSPTYISNADLPSILQSAVVFIPIQNNPFEELQRYIE